MAKKFTIIYGGIDSQGYVCDVLIEAFSYRDAAYRHIRNMDPKRLAQIPDYNMVPIEGPSGKERWIRVPNPNLTDVPLGFRVGEKTANKSYKHF